MSIKRIAVVGLVAGLCALGCQIPESRTATGIVATDTNHVWVTRSLISNGKVVQEIYRCGDVAAETAAPQPVCVKAPLMETK